MNVLWLWIKNNLNCKNYWNLGEKDNTCTTERLGRVIQNRRIVEIACIYTVRWYGYRDKIYIWSRQDTFSEATCSKISVRRTWNKKGCHIKWIRLDENSTKAWRTNFHRETIKQHRNRDEKKCNEKDTWYRWLKIRIEHKEKYIIKWKKFSRLLEFGCKENVPLRALNIKYAPHRRREKLKDRS